MALITIDVNWEKKITIKMYYYLVKETCTELHYAYFVFHGNYFDISAFVAISIVICWITDYPESQKNQFLSGDLIQAASAIGGISSVYWIC